MEIPEPDHQYKVPVIRRPDYSVHLEQATRVHTFIHCDVRRWSPQTKRALAEDFATLKSLHGGPLYALHEPSDHKHHKFLAMYGFKWAASFSDRHHRRMEIYVTH